MKRLCPPREEVKEELHMTGTTELQSRETASFCIGFWSNETTYNLEEKHITQQYSK